VEVKNEIKSILAMNGWSMTEVVKLLNEKNNGVDSVQNLSNKLTKGTLRYSEALKIAEIIGCKIVWVNNEKK